MQYSIMANYFRIWTPIFRWYISGVLLCVDLELDIEEITYLKEIPSNMFKICYPFYSRFSSQHDCGHLCDHLTSMRIFILIMDKIFRWAPNITRQWLWAQIGFANHLAWIVYFLSYKRWVHRGKYPNNIHLSQPGLNDIEMMRYGPPFKVVTW